ncbi:MAG: NAD+ kinase [Planctomycetaceae bacterium]|nr:NAD+ kinase [Planctomycetaceae bacterium]
MRPGIAIVTRPTRMAGLLQRWATRGAAKFALVTAKRAVAARAPATVGFSEQALQASVEREYVDLVSEDDAYHASLSNLAQTLDFGMPVQFVDRNFLPNFDFARYEVVVVVGQDGLVANAAKYVGDVPIVAVNPDPQRIDGILLPFQLEAARDAVAGVLAGRARTRDVTLAEVNLHDGQRLLAFNDLFVGCNSHVSARYRLQVDRHKEQQSSSGILISTGAGSTGWLSSVFNMAAGVAQWLGGVPPERPQLNWDDRQLVWAVREPFVSRSSQAKLVIGRVPEGRELVVESLMPAAGVIFSDGVEADFLEFNTGAIANIGVSGQRARLVVP